MEVGWVGNPKEPNKVPNSTLQISQRDRQRRWSIDLPRLPGNAEGRERCRGRKKKKKKVIFLFFFFLTLYAY